MVCHFFHAYIYFSFPSPPGAAFACFVASGQTCVSGTRLIVEDSIYEEFVSAFIKKAKSIEERIGDRASFNIVDLEILTEYDYL
jgi:hypothetical protein